MGRVTSSKLKHIVNAGGRGCLPSKPTRVTTGLFQSVGSCMVLKGCMGGFLICFVGVELVRRNSLILEYP